MKYRIKEVRYNDASEFYPQRKVGFFWVYFRNCGGDRLKSHSLVAAQAIIDSEIAELKSKTKTTHYHYYGQDS